MARNSWQTRQIDAEIELLSSSSCSLRPRPRSMNYELLPRTTEELAPPRSSPLATLATAALAALERCGGLTAECVGLCRELLIEGHSPLRPLELRTTQEGQQPPLGFCRVERGGAALLVLLDLGGGACESAVRCRPICSPGAARFSVVRHRATRSAAVGAQRADRRRRARERGPRRRVLHARRAARWRVRRAAAAARPAVPARRGAAAADGRRGGGARAPASSSPRRLCRASRALAQRGGAARLDAMNERAPTAAADQLPRCALAAADDTGLAVLVAKLLSALHLSPPTRAPPPTAASRPAGLLVASHGRLRSGQAWQAEANRMSALLAALAGRGRGAEWFPPHTSRVELRRSPDADVDGARRSPWRGRSCADRRAAGRVAGRRRRAVGAPPAQRVGGGAEAGGSVGGGGGAAAPADAKVETVGRGGGVAAEAGVGGAVPRSPSAAAAAASSSSRRRWGAGARWAASAVWSPTSRALSPRAASTSP